MAQSFEVGTALNPYLAQLLTNLIAEAITPKATRMQEQRQIAQTELERLHPKISKLAEADKRAFQDLFFRARGIYQPPLLRQLFGAGEEPILPLPEGSTEKGKFVKGPFGIGGRMQKQFIIPEARPFQFAEEPILSPGTEAELRRVAGVLGYDEDETKELIDRYATKTSRAPEAVRARIISRADKLVAEAVKGGMTREQAIESLPPTLQRPFKEHEEEFRTKIGAREATTEATEALKKERLDRPIREREKEGRLAAQHKDLMELAGRKLAIISSQAERMLKNRTLDTQTRSYIQMMKSRMEAQLRRETAYNSRQMDFFKSDPTFQPSFREDTTLFDEWDSLYAKVMSMGEEGGVGGAPGIAPPISKVAEAEQNFRKKHGLPPAKGR